MKETKKKRTKLMKKPAPMTVMVMVNVIMVNVNATKDLMATIARREVLS